MKDIYVKFGSPAINGESQDKDHKDWVEVSSWQHSIVQPRSATASTAGGHTAERCEHSELAITKLADLASPVLLQTCSSGKTIPKAKLEFMRADGQGERVKYFEIELENVLIGSIQPGVAEGDFMASRVDSASFQLRRMTLEAWICVIIERAWPSVGSSL